LVLGAIAFGVLTFDPEGVASLPTPTPIVITATPEPRTNTPVAPPTDLPAPTNAPTDVPAGVVALSFPTTTPTPNAPSMTPVVTLPTILPTTAGLTIPTFSAGAAGGSAAGGAGVGAAPAPGLGDRLQLLASELIPITGGAFAMGTTPAEVAQAVNECLAGYGGAAGLCNIAYGEDSVPQHSVQVDTFFIESTEVSYEQFLTFLNTLGPGAHRNGCGGFPCAQTRTESETSNMTFDGSQYTVPPVVNNLAVTNVTWYGAFAYCEALGRRLPTETEWERAARGDTGFIYPWGTTWDATRANTSRPAVAETPLGKTAVTLFPTGASPYGILNMAGNVAEWVSDWYDPTFYRNPAASTPNTTGPAAGTNKVVRGGSWDAVPFFARTVHRQDRLPNDPTAWIGFRCASDNAAVPIVPTAAGGAPLGVFTPTAEIGGAAIPPGGAAVGSEEESLANAQPTQPPAPISLATNTPVAPALPTATLAAGG
jgi:formylglycine-generating enzyme required for sulfatase activity